jgi:hypothetical protein
MVDALLHQNEYSNFIMVAVGATLVVALLHSWMLCKLIMVALFHQQSPLGIHILHPTPTTPKRI